MKEIPLTQGKVALVDDEDYEWLNQWKWKAHRFAKKWYACRTQRVGLRSENKFVTWLMHRKLLKLEDPSIFSDHRDGNGLNNQRHNLRVATGAQNAQNIRTKAGGTSKYRGVSWQKKNQNWIAQIKCGGKHMHIGSFQTQKEAAQAYDRKAKELHGEFANLNFPEAS